MYLALAATPRFADADLSQPAAGAERRCADPRVAAAHLARPRPDDHPGLRPDRGLARARRCCAPTTACASSGTAGTPCFFTDVRVVADDRDAEDRRTRGGAGLRPQRDPRATGRTTRRPPARSATEWLHTGDLATATTRATCTIVDRLKDMYISGGENVYPAEVERALHDHPAVAECAVIGVPDETLGRGRPRLRRRPRGRASSTRRRCSPISSGRLARYKLPKSVVFVRRAAPQRLRQAAQVPSEGERSPRDPLRPAHRPRRGQRASTSTCTSSPTTTATSRSTTS